MQIITLDDRQISAPSCMNELSSGDLRALLTMVGAGVNGHTLALSMALRALGLRPLRVGRRPGGDGLALVVAPRGRLIYRCLPLLETHALILSQGFLFDNCDPFQPLRPALTSPRSIPLRGLQTLGEALEGFSLGDFLTVESIRLHPGVQGPMEWLPLLLRDGRGERPSPRRAARALRPGWVRSAMQLYYHSGLEALQRRFPTIFHRAEGGDSHRMAPNGGPMGLIYGLANGDPLRVEPLMATPLYHALMTLTMISPETV